jgi:hypothetical protein
VNPCNSKLHPSVTEAGIEPESEEEVSVQEAYTPESTCWGCGAPAAAAAAACSRPAAGPARRHACCEGRQQAAHASRLRMLSSAASRCIRSPRLLLPCRERLPLPAPPLVAGPAAADGLFLQSYRIPGGLEATAVLDPKYCAFPGETGGWREGSCAAPPCGRPVLPWVACPPPPPPFGQAS